MITLHFTLEGSFGRGWEVGCQSPLTQTWVWRNVKDKGRKPHPLVVAQAQDELRRELQAQAQLLAAKYAQLARELGE